MNDNNKYEEDKKEIENSHIIEMKKICYYIYKWYC